MRSKGSPEVVPARRKSANALFQGLCYARDRARLSALCLSWIALYNGIGGLSLRVFTEITPGPGSQGGLLNAIVGSLIMTVLGVAGRHADRHSRRHLHGGIRPLRSGDADRALHQRHPAQRAFDHHRLVRL